MTGEWGAPTDGSATIFELSMRGDLTGLERRLRSGSADVNSVTRDGFAALHFAVEEGRLEVVDLLLANGADVDLPSVSGATPLFMVPLAPRSTQIELVGRLVAKGALPTCTNRQGMSARDYIKTLGGKPLREWIEEQIRREGAAR